MPGLATPETLSEPPMLAYSVPKASRELDAGGVAHRHVDVHGVEVEGLGALAPLGAVDEAQRGVDADAAQLLGEGREVLLGVGARVHHLEAELLPFGPISRPPSWRVAGVVEERERLALAGAVALAGPRPGRATAAGSVRMSPMPSGSSARSGSSTALLLGRGRALGDHVAALPVARAARCSTPWKRVALIHSKLNMVSIACAHARVLQGLAAEVEEDAAGEGDGAGGDLGGDDVAALLARGSRSRSASGRRWSRRGRCIRRP